MRFLSILILLLPASAICAEDFQTRLRALDTQRDDELMQARARVQWRANQPNDRYLPEHARAWDQYQQRVTELHQEYCRRTPPTNCLTSHQRRVLESQVRIAKGVEERRNGWLREGLSAAEIRRRAQEYEQTEARRPAGQTETPRGGSSGTTGSEAGRTGRSGETSERVTERGGSGPSTGGLTVTPGGDQTETPNRTQTENPNRTQTENPTRTQTENQNRTQTENPNRTQTENPNRTQTENPNRTQTENPNRTQTENPGRTENNPDSSEDEATPNRVEGDALTQADAERRGNTAGVVTPRDEAKRALEAELEQLTNEIVTRIETVIQGDAESVTTQNRDRVRLAIEANLDQVLKRHRELCGRFPRDADFCLTTERIRELREQAAGRSCFVDRRIKQATRLTRDAQEPLALTAHTEAWTALNPKRCQTLLDRDGGGGQNPEGTGLTDQENAPRNYDPSSCKWVADLPRRIVNAPGCNSTSRTRVCTGYVICNQLEGAGRFIRMSTCRPQYCGAGDQNAANCTKDMSYFSQKPPEEQREFLSPRLKNILSGQASEQ